MLELGALGLAWLLVLAAALAIYRASPRQALGGGPTPRGLLPAAVLASVLASALMAWVHGTVPGVLLAFCGLMMGVISIPSLLVWHRGGPSGTGLPAKGMPDPSDHEEEGA